MPCTLPAVPGRVPVRAARPSGAVCRRRISQAPQTRASLRTSLEAAGCDLSHFGSSTSLSGVREQDTQGRSPQLGGLRRSIGDPFDLTSKRIGFLGRGFGTRSIGKTLAEPFVPLVELLT
jgi:hypothetical protein